MKGEYSIRRASGDIQILVARKVVREEEEYAEMTPAEAIEFAMTLMDSARDALKHRGQRLGQRAQ